MGITTRSGYSTEPNDPTPSADNGDLWAFINHPERWYETFYTGLVDCDEEEEEEGNGMIGDENSTVSDGGDESESIANAMEIGDEKKDGDGAVEGELDERNEDPMEDDDEADETFPVDIPDQDSFAASVEDVETEEGCLRSTSADYGSDVGETEDEGADSPQSDSADDNAHVENLDPSIGKKKGRIPCTCSHCGESGHIRAEKKGILKKLVGLKIQVLRSANVASSAPTVEIRATVVIHAKNYISRQSTPVQGAEKKDILGRPVSRKNPVMSEKSSPESNPPAATVGNTATIVQDAGNSICRQNSSVPGAEKKGMLINAVQRSVNPENMRTAAANVEKTGIIQTPACLWRRSEGSGAPTATRKGICAKPAQAGRAFIVREQTTDLIPVLTINREGIEKRAEDIERQMLQDESGKNN